MFCLGETAPRGSIQIYSVSASWYTTTKGIKKNQRIEAPLHKNPYQKYRMGRDLLHIHCCCGSCFYLTHFAVCCGNLIESFLSMPILARALMCLSVWPFLRGFIFSVRTFFFFFFFLSVFFRWNFVTLRFSNNNPTSFVFYSPASLRTSVIPHCLPLF